MRKFAATAGLIIALSSLAACETTGETTGMAEARQQHMGGMMGVKRAVAALHPTQGNEARGIVQFTQRGDELRVRARFTGLEPGSTHGIHIHEFGDITAADGTAAGGHYDPEGHDHALPPDSPRHAGDLGNLTADDEGNATMRLTVDNISLAGPNNPILGRGMILHAKEDDGSQPTGAAGARIAQGVIGVDQAK